MAIRRQKIEPQGKNGSKLSRENISLIVAEGNASEDTIATYRSRLKQFYRWCDLQNIYPALVKREQIQQYRKYLLDKGLASSSISLSLIAVKHFYTSCVAESLVTFNPVLGVKAPKEKRVLGSTIKSLSEKQLQQLMDLVLGEWVHSSKQTWGLENLRDTVLICLMVIQGCRTIEVHRANVGDLASVEEEVYLTVDGKTSIRRILLRQDLVKIIEQYLDLRASKGEKLVDSSPLLISLSHSHQSKRLSRRGIRYLVDNYLARCGLKSHGESNQWTEDSRNLASRTEKRQNFSTHSLRHTAGTLSLRNGASLREVQDFLGHSDPKQTAIYTSLIGDAENNPANKIKITLPNIDDN
jgi:integrase/recombinase XerD